MSSCWVLKSQDEETGATYLEMEIFLESQLHKRTNGRCQETTVLRTCKPAKVQTVPGQRATWRYLLSLSLSVQLAIF